MNSQPRELELNELEDVSGGTPAKDAPKTASERPTESLSLTFTHVAFSN